MVDETDFMNNGLPEFRLSSFRVIQDTIIRLGGSTTLEKLSKKQMEKILDWGLDYINGIHWEREDVMKHLDIIILAIKKYQISPSAFLTFKQEFRIEFSNAMGCFKTNIPFYSLISDLNSGSSN